MKSSDEDSDAIDEETKSYLNSLIHYSNHNLENTDSPPNVVDSVEPEDNSTNQNNIDHSQVSSIDLINPHLILSRLESVKNTVTKRLQKSKMRDAAYGKFITSLQTTTDDFLSQRDITTVKKTFNTSGNCIVTEKDDASSDQEDDSLYEINRSAFSETLCSSIAKHLPVFENVESDSSEQSLKEESKYCKQISRSNPTMNIQQIVQQSTCNLTQLVSVKADPWRLLKESTTQISSSRYYSRAANNATCENCLKKGHFTSQCERSGPVCILCSQEGHRHIDCPQKVCHACFATGHSIEKCPAVNRLRDLHCNRCDVKGHDEKLCPEQWRQYHATTIPGPPVRPKRVRHLKITCCNCAKHGHFQNECYKHRPKSKFLSQFITQTVGRYDKKDIYHQINNKSSQYRDLTQPKTTIVFNESEPVASTSHANPITIDSSPEGSVRLENDPPSSTPGIMNITSTTDDIPKSAPRVSKPLEDFVPFEMDHKYKASKPFKKSNNDYQPETPHISKKILRKSLKRKKRKEFDKLAESDPIAAKISRPNRYLLRSSQKPTPLIPKSKSKSLNNQTVNSAIARTKPDKSSLTKECDNDSSKDPSVNKLTGFASKVSVNKLKQLFPHHTEGKRNLSRSMKRKLRRKLQEYICQGYVPVNEVELTERLEGWLYDVAAGEALTFKKRWSLQNSVSAALQSIDPEYSVQEFSSSQKIESDKMMESKPTRSRKRNRKKEKSKRSTKRKTKSKTKNSASVI